MNPLRFVSLTVGPASSLARSLSFVFLGTLARDFLNEGTSIAEAGGCPPGPLEGGGVFRLAENFPDRGQKGGVDVWRSNGVGSIARFGVNK